VNRNTFVKTDRRMLRLRVNLLSSQIQTLLIANKKTPDPKKTGPGIFHFASRACFLLFRQSLSGYV